MEVRLIDPRRRKFCSHCNKVKDLSEFSISRDRKVSERQAWCKSCMSNYWTSEERREAMRAREARKKQRYVKVKESKPQEPEPQPAPEPAPVHLPESLFERGLAIYEPDEG